jgi:hypothetical protein
MYSSGDEAEVDENPKGDNGENQEEKKEKKIRIKKNASNPQPKLDAQRFVRPV